MSAGHAGQGAETAGEHTQTVPDAQRYHNHSDYYANQQGYHGNDRYDGEGHGYVDETRYDEYHEYHDRYPPRENHRNSLDSDQDYYEHQKEDQGYKNKRQEPAVSNQQQSRPAVMTQSAGKRWPTHPGVIDNNRRRRSSGHSQTSGPSGRPPSGPQSRPSSISNESRPRSLYHQSTHHVYHIQLSPMHVPHFLCSLQSQLHDLLSQRKHTNPLNIIRSNLIQDT